MTAIELPHESTASSGHAHARAKIPVYWLINLVERCVEVMSDPTGDGNEASYSSTVIHRGHDLLEVAIDGRKMGSINVSELFE